VEFNTPVLQAIFPFPPPDAPEYAEDAGVPAAPKVGAVPLGFEAPILPAVIPAGAPVAVTALLVKLQTTCAWVLIVKNTASKQLVKNFIFILFKFTMNFNFIIYIQVYNPIFQSLYTLFLTHLLGLFSLPNTDTTHALAGIDAAKIIIFSLFAKK
jgi:hypothetical protein